MQLCPSCDEKTVLVERLNEARLRYADATRELDQLPISGTAFEDAYEHAENVKLAYELARCALDTHAEEHGC